MFLCKQLICLILWTKKHILNERLEETHVLWKTRSHILDNTFHISDELVMNYSDQLVINESIIETVIQ